MLVINDTHIGIARAGGTTPISRALLGSYTLQQFDNLFTHNHDGYVLINGDLLDGFMIDNRTLQLVFQILRHHADNLEQLYLARGNHDVSKDSTKLSSFDLLCFMLQQASPSRVTVITEPTRIEWPGGAGVVLPHAANQDLFDLWMAQAEEMAAGAQFLFVHANYDNNFAAEADHSLNVSAEQAAELHRTFRFVVFGHEHQASQHKGNGVLVVGNQFPTSISDCLGNDRKKALQLHGNVIHEVETWTAQGSYYECQWTQTHMVPEGSQFVRLVGEASDEQASEVLEAVSRLRKAHDAFVISNAVTINGRALDTSANDALEEVQKFSVLDFICEHMTEPQAETLRTLAAKRESNHA